MPGILLSTLAALSHFNSNSLVGWAVIPHFLHEEPTPQGHVAISGRIRI